MLVEDLMRNSLAGIQTDLVLLDVSKAFDEVSHQKLLLHKYGIRGTALKCIEAFLSERTQLLFWKNEKSDTVPVTFGVPQGSVLGPVLFLIYINDLPDNTKSEVRLIADDKTIYLAVCNLTDAQILQEDLDRLKCEKLWDIEFNPSKSVVIHVTRSRTPIFSQCTLHGQILESVAGRLGQFLGVFLPSSKYLGVEISDNLQH